MKNTVGLKLHGPPMGPRACCLVFICVFPFIFILTLINDLSAGAPILVSALAMIHGFILISLYNVQTPWKTRSIRSVWMTSRLKNLTSKKCAAVSEIPRTSAWNADAQDYLARIATRRYSRYSGFQKFRSMWPFSSSSVVRSAQPSS